jgi:peptidyl-prolyl cis-trans isomerase D
VIFDVASIAASAPAPFAEIRPDVTAMWALERGSVAAKAAAEKVLAQAKQGTDIAQAMAGLGLPLPPVDRIEMGREQLNAARQQVPPPLVLLFSMARGTTKLLPAPDNRGWFVVSLKTIVPGKVAPNDPVARAAQRELGQLAGSEYAEQLVQAMRAELGVKREDGAVAALRRQLEGGN